MQPTTIATTTITTTTKTSDLPPVGALIPSVFWRRNRVSNIQRRDSIGIHVYMTLFGHHCLIWSYIKPLLPSLSLFDFCIAFDVQFSTMPWILPACILKCFWFIFVPRSFVLCKYVTTTTITTDNKKLTPFIWRKILSLTHWRNWSLSLLLLLFLWAHYKHRFSWIGLPFLIYRNQFFHCENPLIALSCESD